MSPVYKSKTVMRGKSLASVLNKQKAVIPGGSPGAQPTYETPGLPGAPVVGPPIAPVAGGKAPGAAPKPPVYKPGKKWTPYNPNAAPPPGTYDPALDAQFRAAQRGLAYQFGSSAANDGGDTGDYDTAQRRAESDFASGLESIGITRGRGNQDLDAQIASLARRYEIQGFNQGQSARRAGVRSGGALQAALNRRTENEAWDRKPIDVSRERLKQDYGDESVPGNYGRQGLELQKNFERGTQDRNNASQRGFEEFEALGTDVLASKQAQAAQTGYLPEKKRKNEYTHSQTGQKYILEKKNGKWVKRLPSGKVVARSDITTMK